MRQPANLPRVECGAPCPRRHRAELETPALKRSGAALQQQRQDGLNSQDRDGLREVLGGGVHLGPGPAVQRLAAELRQVPDRIEDGHADENDSGPNHRCIDDHSDADCVTGDPCHQEHSGACQCLRGGEFFQLRRGGRAQFSTGALEHHGQALFRGQIGNVKRGGCGHP
jgi:hypothetical protein